MGQQQEEKLIEKFNLVKNRIMRNKLIIVTVINVITFLTMIFAMSYYQWVWVYLIFNKGRYNEQTFQFWVNLLYIKEDVEGSSYQSFQKVEERICQKNIYCSAIIYEFQFVGYVSFSIIVIAGCLQLYDFVRMFIYVWKSGKILETKDNFRHLVSISTYVVGLTLSAFSVRVISPDSSAYGVSFWVSVATLCVFVAVIIYQQISIRRIVKQALIMDLIQKEKNIRAEELKNRNMEMSNSVSVEAERELTL